MQTYKTLFDIRDYGEKGVMLIRIQERPKPGNMGLGNSVSQCIMMQESEIDNLMEVLNAHKRRDKEL